MVKIMAGPRGYSQSVDMTPKHFVELVRKRSFVGLSRLVVYFFIDDTLISLISPLFQISDSIFSRYECIETHFNV
jgi:hypothetical protein